MTWLDNLRTRLGEDPKAWRCPECERPETHHHHADCSQYPHIVVKP